MLPIEYLLLFNPFFIIATFIIYYKEEKKRKNEVILFGKEIRNTKKVIYTNISIGILVGILTSLFITLIGVEIDIYILYIYIISIILSFIDKRFICMSYGGSILSIVFILLSDINNSKNILYLIGIFHLAEGIIIYINSYKNRMPLYLEENGEIKAGYYFDSIWVIPIITSVEGFFILFPFLLGYKNLITSGDIKFRTKKSAINSILYGSSIVLFLFLIQDNKVLLFLLCLYSIVIHELIIKINTHNWRDNRYLCSKNGVRVLDVLDENIFFKPLDTIIEINNHKVQNIDDIKRIIFIYGKFYEVKYTDEKDNIKKLNINSCKLNIVPLINNPNIIAYTDKFRL
ncbi:hypothetical protein GOQ27_03025 [Clostridium sp. D2Q-11]|uniref:PDZ domain-containing protein n=1 Tax=Anaeromonas frigoriresistens TaxID=2683708 RepID=A0A942UXH2_9FIRM|nr:hypothetical protein [Anaeromonas frigoriresistens]MBS4537417.1 hypothetical protein [Anaeromonas frigoriresistens]